jgi:hypothetical protein
MTRKMERQGQETRKVRKGRANKGGEGRGQGVANQHKTQ